MSAPTLPTIAAYRLTAARRRAVCFHEAGHAVLHGLGGAWVYAVEVAPEGVSTWETTSRKGARMVDLWGVCSASDGPALGFIGFDEESGDWWADRRRFREVVRMLGQHRKGAAREMRRQVRAQVCAALAGPAAESLHLGHEPCLDDEGEWGVWDDAKQACSHAWLLPWRNELEFLHGLTVRTLREPAVWDCVERLAGALELAGRLGDDEADFAGLLPAARRHWPPSSRSRTEGTT